MCLIIYSANGNIPRRHLRRALTKNPDGWGVMIHDGTRVVVEKGMSRRKFWAVWHARPKGPVVFHSRIGTHGTQDETNCHPFPIPNHDLVMAHNGIIHECGKKGSPLSDTQHFVQDILAHLPQGFLAIGAMRRLIRNFIGHSKLVFMDGAGKVTILNEGKGHWFKGRWYSNDSYKEPVWEWSPKDSELDWTPRSLPPQMFDSRPGLFSELKPMQSGVKDSTLVGTGMKIVDRRKDI